MAMNKNNLMARIRLTSLYMKEDSSKSLEKAMNILIEGWRVANIPSDSYELSKIQALREKYTKIKGSSPSAKQVEQVAKVSDEISQNLEKIIASRSYHTTFAEIRIGQKRYQDAELSIRKGMEMDEQIRETQNILYLDQEKYSTSTPLYCIYGEYLLKQKDFDKNAKEILQKNSRTMKFIQKLPKGDDFQKEHVGTINEVWYQCVKHIEQADPDDDVWLTKVWKNIPATYLEY
jgi:hypothetical protein